MSSVISTDRVGFLHRTAMELSDRALEARAAGDRMLAEALFRQSFESESQAASLVADAIDLEPTRSILHRSAATLALDCSEYRAAERLIAAALAGDPPGDIAEELRDLLEQVNFARHLELRGLRLAPNEFQLSISGRKVGFGMVLSQEFVDRVQAAEKLIVRTFERLAGRPFREAGRAVGDILRNCELYLSTPRPASFAATLRVGLPARQMNLPGIDPVASIEPERIIDEVADCLEAVGRDNGDRLTALIPEPAYRRNFLALAGRILPDGDNVSQVGLTVSRDGSQRKISLFRPEPTGRSAEAGPENGHIRVEGLLLYASATSGNRIKVVDDDGRSHPFTVPSGMMADIVKPLWEDRVSVLGVKPKPGRKSSRLEEITRAPGPTSGG